MGGSDFSLLFLVLITVLSTCDRTCALPAKDVEILEATSQPLLVTPSHDLPQWTVRDTNNKICMMMAMNATIQFDPKIPIPSSATATPKTGSCDSENAWFTLNFVSDGYSYAVSILFKVDRSSYKMVEIQGEKRRGLNIISWTDKSSGYPSASTGNSMICKNFNTGMVYFTEYQFQPFAQDSQEQYGKAEVCSFPSGMGTSVWAYLVLVAIFLVVVAVIVGIVVVIVKKVNAKRGYTQIQ